MLKDRELIKDTVDKLIQNKVKNFEIIVISRTKAKFPIRMWKYIKVLHNPNFPKMYKEIENADFLLPLLDPINPEHHHYLTDCASGAKQLVLGFLTPCLINSEFAQKYGFSDKDSILYEDKNLYNAMNNAINIKQDEYASMQSNLKILADNVYKESLNNLKTSIERIESAK